MELHHFHRLNIVCQHTVCFELTSPQHFRLGDLYGNASRSTFSSAQLGNANWLVQTKTEINQLVLVASPPKTK